MSKTPHSKTENSTPITTHPNKSQAWKVAFIGYLTSFVLSVKEALGLIPKPFYPNNPKDSGFFGKLNTPWGLKISNALFLVGSLFSVTDTWGAIKDFYYDNEKNWKKAVVLAIRVLLSSALIAMFTLVKIGTAVLIFKFLPYLLIGAVGLKAVYHLGRCVYEVYQFFKTGESKHGWAALVELAKIAGYALALTALVLFSIKINSDFMQLNSNLLNDLLVMRKVGNVYQAMQGLIFTCCAVLTVAMVPEFYVRASQMNEETLNYLEHPIENLTNTIKEKAKAFSDFCKAHPYAAVALALPIILLDGVNMVSTAILRLAALPLHVIIRPLNKVGNWIRQKFKKVTPETPTDAESSKTVDSPTYVVSATTSPNSSVSQNSTPAPERNSPPHMTSEKSARIIGVFGSRHRDVVESDPDDNSHSSSNDISHSCRMRGQS